MTATALRLGSAQREHRMREGEIEQIFRDEAGRVLATLIRLVGDFELAEEAVQEAFAIAVEQWPMSGIPSNPRAWLINVGRHEIAVLNALHSWPCQARASPLDLVHVRQPPRGRLVTRPRITMHPSLAFSMKSPTSHNTLP